jgi:carbon starvation protein CstA
MNTLPVLVGAPCVYPTASRYYSVFIAAKALMLEDRRSTLPGTASGSVRLR